MTVAAAGILLFFSHFSYAETVNSFADLNYNPRTLSFLRSRPVIEAVYRLGIEQDKKFGLVPGCKSDYSVKPINIFVVSPIDFPDDKQHPTKGEWKYNYRIERCGETKIYTALFVANEHGEFPKYSMYYPGWTRADLALVKDAMPTIRDTALSQAGVRNCKEVDVFDMRVTKQPRDVIVEDESTGHPPPVHMRYWIITGVWEETWTFKVGGKMVDIIIAFVPNSERGGTDYVIMPNKTQ